MSITSLKLARKDNAKIQSWQQALADVVTDITTLCDLLALTPQDIGFSADAVATFPLRIPKCFIQRMNQGDPRDPLLLQVLALRQETQLFEGFSVDPLLERQANPVPGLLHKYANRVLVTVSGQCAIHCRYCFRRHFPYADNQLSVENWQKILVYLQQHPEVDEVIFSGGDPLIISNQRLQNCLNDLETIPSIKRIRFHTRLPIVLPERIDSAFCAILASCTLPIIMVVHCNHAQEIADLVPVALTKLKQAGVTLFNQSVLLRGINDDAQRLIELSEALFANGVLPYYLHLLDKVQGAAHFDVPEVEAKALMIAIQKKLPGFLVPKLAREESDVAYKSVL